MDPKRNIIHYTVSYLTPKQSCFSTTWPSMMNPRILRTSMPNQSKFSGRRCSDRMKRSCLKQSPCQFIGTHFLVVKKQLQHLKKNLSNFFQNAACLVMFIRHNSPPASTGENSASCPSQRKDTGTISFNYISKANESKENQGVGCCF